MLDNVSKDALLENLRRRYDEGLIFVILSLIYPYVKTSIGAVLISMNPYKELGVFDKSFVDKYAGKQPFEVTTLFPHNNCSSLLMFFRLLMKPSVPW